MKTGKILICFLSALLICNFSKGQTALGSVEQNKVMERIEEASKKMENMQCEFSQTKTLKLLKEQMVSKGKMYFVQPNKLRWQYTHPYEYTFILNNDKVYINSAAGVQNIDVKENRIFREITDVILKSITGGNLKNTTDFSVELFKQASSYYVRLTPKKRQIKQIYNYIEVYFNPSLTEVSEVKMEEKTGDITLVKLFNTKVNTRIDEKLFSAN